MANLEAELTSLFNKIDAVVLEQKSDEGISKMMEETRGASDQLGECSMEIAAELQNIVDMLRRLNNMKAMSARLATGSESILQHWNTRDVELWGPDEVSAAIEKQCEEATLTLNLMTEHVKTVEAETKDLKVSVQELNAAIERKNAGLKVDQAALDVELNAGDSPSKCQPRSPIKHADWVKSNSDLVAEARTKLKSASAKRSVADEIEKKRIGVQRTTIKACLEALEAKQQEWEQVLEQLPPPVAVEVEKIAKLNALVDQLPEKKELLQQHVIRAELRIVERNARPDEECKSDEAEEALLAELQKFKDLQNELDEAMSRLSEQIVQAQEDLVTAQEKILRAEAARDIDSECWTMEEMLYEAIHDSLAPFCFLEKRVPSAPESEL